MTRLGGSFFYLQQTQNPPDVINADNLEYCKKAPEHGNISDNLSYASLDTGSCNHGCTCRRKRNCWDVKGYCHVADFHETAQTQKKINKMGDQETYEVAIHAEFRQKNKQIRYSGRPGTSENEQRQRFPVIFTVR